MNTDIATTTITAVAGFATSLVTIALPVYLQNRQLKGRVSDLEGSVEQVGRGLAVGYYFNFIEPVCRLLQDVDITVLLQDTDEKGERKQAKFAKDDVRISVIYPAGLTGSQTDRCGDRLKGLSKGEIILGQQRRNFSITYAILLRDGKPNLQICDVAKPTTALKNYLETFENKNPGDPEWPDLAERGLKSFFDTIKNLCERAQGAGVNQLLFDPVN
jgi:hypothetical protein